MRPDKAIDALDEACAHLQAVVQYPHDVEALVRERMAILRRLHERGEAPSTGPAAADARETIPPPPPDPIMSALERFGAEIEAMFVGPAAGRGQSARGAAPSAAPASEAPPAPARSVPRTLGAVESELTRRLTEEGIVVRGHDVARVVALTTGAEVKWENDPAGASTENAQ